MLGIGLMYDKLMARKRKWTVKPVAGPGCGRAIFVLLPFVTWNSLLAILSPMLSTMKYLKSRELLISNVRDEENHDFALGYIADAYGVDEKAEAEALKLQQAWIAHPDHTVLKAMVAERAIFFVLLPFFFALTVMLQCVQL